MKRFALSIMVCGIFLLYSLGIRHESPVLAKPVSLADTARPNSPSTTGSSPPPTSMPSSTTTTTPSSSSSASSGQYKDGTYTGSVADAYYGNVQVSATISGGKITNVTFLQYPDTHSTSVAINSQAMPYLQQEAIQAQNANVQIVSGATFTSQAFIQSLQAALSQAHA